MASYLSYNGVVLDVSRTILYAQEPYYSEDGGDLIGVKVTLEVEAIYNPSAVSYVEDYVGEIRVARRQPGRIAPETDVAVSQFLAVPRAELIYVVGNTVVIRSPLPGAGLDLASGPRPLSVSVRPGLTEKTWRVGFRVETVLSDCPVTTTGLMSNRWTQSHETGPDHLTTIVTEGVTVFRSDVLANLGVTADFFRSVCLPPHFFDFQRVNITVRLNSIGNALTWRVVDRERYTSLGLTTARAYGVIDFQAETEFSSVPTDPVMGVSTSIAMGSFAAIARGDRNSSRAGLHAWLNRLAIERLNVPVGVKFNPDVHPVLVRISAKESIDAPICTLMMTVRYQPPETLENPAAMVYRYLGIDTTPLFAEGLIAGTNPQNPGGTRGHYRGMAFSQLLKSSLAACAPPARALGVVTVPGYGPPDSSGIGPVREDSYLAGSKPFVDVSVGPPLPGPRVRSRLRAALASKGVQDQKSEVSVKTESFRVVAPTASTNDGGAPSPPLVFELANPLSCRVASWEVERFGAKPVVPTVTSGDPREVAVSAEMNLVSPIIGPDMENLIYRAEGEYAYFYTGEGTRGPGDSGVPMGSLPYITTEYNTPETTVLASDYDGGGWVSPRPGQIPGPTPGPNPGPA